MNTPSQPKLRDHARFAVIGGYALALVCLIYVLHGIHPRRALSDVANVSWKWVILGMVFDVISYGVQGLRWQLLLRPFGRVRLREAVRAVYAGLFANLLFPLRPGELLRTYLIAKKEEIGFGRVLGSVGVERLVDLVIAVASLAIASLFIPLPPRFKRNADALGIVTLVLVGLVVAAILYLELRLGNDAELRRGTRRLPGRFMAALTDLHAMGTSPSFYLAVLGSVWMPFCQVLALWSMMESYRLGLPFIAAIIVLLVINIGVSLPNAPANVGSYQFFCVLGLSIFQVDKTTAAGFSIFAFVGLTIPFLFLGFLAMVRSGLSWRAMRDELHRLAPAAQRKTSACPEAK